VHRQPRTHRPPAPRRHRPGAADALLGLGCDPRPVRPHLGRRRRRNPATTGPPVGRPTGPSPRLGTTPPIDHPPPITTGHRLWTAHPPRPADQTSLRCPAGQQGDPTPCRRARWPGSSAQPKGRIWRGFLSAAARGRGCPGTPPTPPGIDGNKILVLGPLHVCSAFTRVYRTANPRPAHVLVPDHGQTRIGGVGGGELAAAVGGLIRRRAVRCLCQGDSGPPRRLTGSSAMRHRHVWHTDRVGYCGRVGSGLLGVAGASCAGGGDRAGGGKRSADEEGGVSSAGGAPCTGGCAAHWRHGGAGAGLWI